MSTNTSCEENVLHTPGPWSCAQIWRGPETKVHVAFEGRRIALAEVYTMHTAGEKEANALLIAAAPDLLEALKAAQQRLELIDGNDEPAVAVRHMIGNALAKSVGA